MNKYQRHEAIIRWVNEQGTVRVWTDVNKVDTKIDTI